MEFFKKNLFIKKMCVFFFFAKLHSLWDLSFLISAELKVQTSLDGQGSPWRLESFRISLDYTGGKNSKPELI